MPVTQNMCQVWLSGSVTTTSEPIGKLATSVALTRSVDEGNGMPTVSREEFDQAPNTVSESLGPVPGPAERAPHSESVPEETTTDERPQPEPAIRTSRSISWTEARALWRNSISLLMRLDSSLVRKNAVNMPSMTMPSTASVTMSSMSPNPRSSRSLSRRLTTATLLPIAA